MVTHTDMMMKLHQLCKVQKSNCIIYSPANAEERLIMNSLLAQNKIGMGRFGCGLDYKDTVTVR